MREEKQRRRGSDAGNQEDLTKAGKGREKYARMGDIWKRKKMDMSVKGMCAGTKDESRSLRGRVKERQGYRYLLVIHPKEKDGWSIPFPIRFPPVNSAVVLYTGVDDGSKVCQQKEVLVVVSSFVRMRDRRTEVAARLGTRALLVNPG
ncbi:hypothetical protein B0H13DRAFT_1891871 [Mycena leptocephala]|nr:hypothetical protein B0H13DRAFT_1891871 [Mycena leptocephala]